MFKVILLMDILLLFMLSCFVCVYYNILARATSCTLFVNSMIVSFRHTCWW
jgi:hypothetical protein